VPLRRERFRALAARPFAAEAEERCVAPFTGACDAARRGRSGRLVVARDAGRRDFGLALLRAPVLFLDSGIDLFAMDLDLGGRFDPDLHLTRTDLEHRDLDRVPDPDVFP
jgi:hypothetical protein